MSPAKTRLTSDSAEEFLNAIPDETKRRDSLALLRMFEEATGEQARMWGPSIVGFGQHHLKSARSSQGDDWPRAAFSPRKQSLTLYVSLGFDEELLRKLGKHTTSKSCLYIKKLADVDEDVLREVIKKNMDEMKKRYPL